MKTRREFVKLAAVAGLVGATRGSAAPAGAEVPRPASGSDDRRFWMQLAAQLANPVLGALANRQLKALMPVESHAPAERSAYTHLEALGRLLAGLAPWLESDLAGSPEETERRQLGPWARAGLDAATDPASPDFMNFSRGQQPLVDAAFLAQALLRAPRALWGRLEPRVRANLVAALKSSRVIKPPETNWVLFASMIEAALHRFGEEADEARLLGGLERFRRWYLGDGIYGDGPEFHWDYYNSFVIHPMLLEILEVVGEAAGPWQAFRDQERRRLTRWAAIQERMIAPDGSYPVVGRSIAYRAGAFQGLTLASWRQLLPDEVVPGQARAALTAVIRRTLTAPATFDEQGWLRIGVSGHQPSLGEEYISTGSLYLCSAAFLPLGLPPTAPFWLAPPAPTTWQKVWSGTDLPSDHALRNPG